VRQKSWTPVDTPRRSVELLALLVVRRKRLVLLDADRAQRVDCAISQIEPG
jgi:hypothetical protein